MAATSVARLQLQNRLTAIVGAIAFHALLLGLLFFSIIKLPEPPILGGGEGIVLNYGVDEEGAGDTQTTAAANDSPNKEDSAPSDAEPTPAEPEQTPEPTPEPTPEAQPPVTSDVEETVSLPVKEAPKPEPKPVKEAPKPEPPKPVVNTAATYNPNKGGNGKSGTSNTPTGNNNGDRPGRVGDQGDPNGSLNSNALYGTPGKGRGGSGNGSLAMPGWTWDNPPIVVDNSSESGILKFRIKINPDGEIESIIKIEGNVSPAVEQLYRNELEETSFRRLSDGGVDAGASGTVTFILRAR